MKKSLLIAATASFALVIGACGQRDDTAANDDLAVDDSALANDMAGDTNNAMAAAPMAAGEFASTIAASDMYEIESGRLASTKASDASMKSFAQMLVTDHQKSTADLKAAAGQSSPPIDVAPALTAEQQSQLDQLKAASGPEFDRLFVQQQVAAHEKGLSALQGYAAGGDNAALKGFATKASSVVEGHLNQLKAMGR